MDSLSLWNEYKKHTSLDIDESYAGSFSFEAKGFGGNERIASVLSGKKRAAFSSYPTYAIDNDMIPVSGELYVLEDNSGNAVCIIEVTGVDIVPFNQVTWDMAALEGEDENLEAWREKQREYLEEEADIVGFDFTEDLRLVFMTFNVVFRA